MRRALDINPLTGETVWFEDTQDGNFSITHEQVVDDILERNKKLANDTDRTKHGIKEEWFHYATIPNIIQMKWSQEIGGDIMARENRKELFKRLNDPEFKYLKTTHARHTVKEG